WALPTTLPCGVRTFLETREGTSPTCVPRPPGRLLHFADQYRSRSGGVIGLEEPGRGRIGLPAGALPGEPLVDAHIGELVRVLVALPRHVLQLHARKGSDERPGLLVQSDQGWVLHPESPRQLLDQEATVRAKGDVPRTELLRLLEPGDGRPVLGDVVRGDPDPLRDLREDLPPLVPDDGSDRGRPGVPPGRTITLDDYAPTRIRRQYSHLFTPSWRLSRESSIAESFWWHPWHTPST